VSVVSEGKPQLVYSLAMHDHAVCLAREGRREQGEPGWLAGWLAGSCVPRRGAGDYQREIRHGLRGLPMRFPGRLLSALNQLTWVSSAKCIPSEIRAYVNDVVNASRRRRTDIADVT
jgi:hypothetical protein